MKKWETFAGCIQVGEQELGKKTWDTLFLLAADYPHEKECWDDDEMSDKMNYENYKQFIIRFFRYKYK